MGTSKRTIGSPIEFVIVNVRVRRRTFTPVGSILMSSGMMEMRLFSRDTPVSPFFTRQGAKLMM